jgi:redox-sensitive bicupin YhaK (pirin superfamily)
MTPKGPIIFDLQHDPLFGSETLILFGDGDTVYAATDRNPVRFLLIAGKPIREPVAWHGPIVMNTQEELRLAFEELEKGTFIKSA